MKKEVNFVSGPFYMWIETQEIESVDKKGIIHYKYIPYDGLLKFKHICTNTSIGYNGEEPSQEYIELLTLYTYPDIEERKDFKIKFVFPHNHGYTESKEAAERLPSRREIYHISSVESFVYELDKLGAAIMCYRFCIEYRLTDEEKKDE